MLVASHHADICIRQAVRIKTEILKAFQMWVKRWCVMATLWFLGSLEAIIRNYKTRLKRPSAASGEGLSSAPPTGAQRIPAVETEESAVHAIGYRFVSSKGLVDGA